jgi:hypothetical protein
LCLAALSRSHLKLDLVQWFETMEMTCESVCIAWMATAACSVLVKITSWHDGVVALQTAACTLLPVDSSASCACGSACDHLMLRLESACVLWRCFLCVCRCCCSLWRARPLGMRSCLHTSCRCGLAAD